MQICFEFEKEKLKFLNDGITYYDKDKQNAIAKQFKKSLIGQGLIKKQSVFGFFKPLAKDSYLAENIWVVYGAFEPIAKMEATSKISADSIQKLKDSLSNNDIWHISVGFLNATFFLYTDKKLKEYDKPEIKKEWANRYFDLVKEYDEFGYFERKTTTIYLDSKENFDNNYQSSWFYYYK